MAIGTFCTFSERFCAVTITSSSWPRVVALDCSLCAWVDTVASKPTPEASNCRVELFMMIPLLTRQLFATLARSCTHSAVDNQRAAGDETALPGRQEQHGRSDLLRRGVPPERNQFVEELAGVAPEHCAERAFDARLEF